MRWSNALAVVTASLALPALAAAPPLEAFFRQPAMAQAALSPDGRRVAFLVSEAQGRPRLAVLDLQTMKPTVVASFTGSSVDRHVWVNPTRLAFTLRMERESSSGRYEYGQGLFAVDADGGNYRQLVDTQRAWAKRGDAPEPVLPWNHYLLGALPRADGDEVLAERPDAFGKEWGYQQLLRIDTRTGRAREIETPQHGIGWVVDAQGEPVSVRTFRGDEQTIALRQPDGSWKTVATGNRVDDPPVTPRWLSPDGVLYATAKLPRLDTRAVVTLDRASGAVDETVLAVDGFDVAPRFVADERGLLGLRLVADGETTVWFDERMKALQARIDELLPATANHLTPPRRGDSPWVLVHATGDTQPDLYFAYHTVDERLVRLGGSRPGIDPKAMGRTEFVRLRARDGLELPAYLTLPSASARPEGAGKPPLVVLVHGGPWVRGASWRWNAEVQFLASRGWAVLEPEFRGSTGYGARLFRAGLKQWGKAMQTDLVDAARWAIAQRPVDGNNVCLMGASYGGYAVLTGLAQAPELFRCGIAYAAVTDVNLMFSAWWSDVNDDAKQFGYARLIGDPEKDREALAAVSPVNFADRIRQPLLLAYGELDQRVPLEHGKRMRDALAKARGGAESIEWVSYPLEDHGWSRHETRLDFYGRVERFLARQLAAPAEASR